MYDTDSNVTITGASSGISTTLATSGGINASANALAIASASTFPSSATTGTIHLKIGDEIMTGTISGTNVTSLGEHKMVQLLQFMLKVQQLSYIKLTTYH